MLYYWGYLRTIEHIYKITNSKYQGYHVIGSDHQRYNHKINPGIFLSIDLDAQENICVDLDNSKILKKIYYNSLKEIKELKKEIDKVSDLDILLVFSSFLKNEVLTSNLKANGTTYTQTENYISRLTEKERYVSPINIDFFIKKGAMVCRHYAVALGSMLERAIEEELLNGKVSVDVNFFRTSTIRFGHAWIRYENNENSYIIDLTRSDQILKLQEYLKIEKKLYSHLKNSIMYTNSLWDYKRPEESPEFIQYYHLKEKLTNKGYQILKRNDSALINKVYLSPWKNYGIYINTNRFSTEIYKFIKNKINTYKDRKVDILEVLLHAYDFYKKMMDYAININIKSEKEILKYIKKHKTNVLSLSELVDNRWTDNTINTLIFGLALELATKDRTLEKIFKGNLTLERDDSSFERGKCFLKFKCANKEYIVDFYHNYVSEFPKKHEVSLWYYAEDY